MKKQKTNINLLLKVLMYLVIITMPLFSSTKLVSAYQFDNTLSSSDEQQINQMMAPLNKAYNIVRIAAISVSVIVLMIAGLLYITGGGDVGKKEKAKSMASYVVAGLMLVVVAPSIVQYIVT